MKSSTIQLDFLCASQNLDMLSHFSFTYLSSFCFFSPLAHSVGFLTPHRRISYYFTRVFAFCRQQGQRVILLYGNARSNVALANKTVHWRKTTKGLQHNTLIQSLSSLKHRTHIPNVIMFFEGARCNSHKNTPHHIGSKMFYTRV